MPAFPCRGTDWVSGVLAALDRVGWECGNAACVFRGRVLGPSLTVGTRWSKVRHSF